MNIFKWIINENKSIFLSQEDGSTPFIYDYTNGKRTYPGGETVPGEVPNYNEIRDIAEGMSQEAYSAAFEQMISLKNEDADGKICSFQPYSFYYDFDESSVGYDKFGILEYGCWCSIGMFGSDENPAIDFNLQKTDKTRQYEIDFKLPRTYEGISFFLNPSTINFLYENIEMEKDNENVSIYLYRGNRRVVPDTVKLTWTCISGDSGSTDTIILNTDKGSFNIKPAMINNFTICKVDVDITYKYKNGDTEETFTGRRTMYYNKVYLLLSSYMGEGDAYSEISMDPAQFKMLVADLERRIESMFHQTCSAITLNLNDAKNKLSTSVEMLPNKIEMELENQIGGMYSRYTSSATERTEVFQNTIENLTNSMKTSAGSTKTFFEDTKKKYLNSGSTSAGQHTQSFSSGLEGLESVYTEGIDGFNSTVSDYNTSSTTIFKQTYNTVQLEAYNAISGLSASIAVSANSASMKVEEASGWTSTIKADMSGVDSKVESIDGTLNSIRTSVSGATVLQATLQDVSGQVAGIEIRPNQILLVNDYNTFSGLTSINDKVIINTDGTLQATNVDVKGIIKCTVCDISQKVLYHTFFDDNNPPTGFACFRDIAYASSYEGLYEVSCTKANINRNKNGQAANGGSENLVFLAYPVVKDTIFRLPFKDSGCYEILLPIDPQYIGSRVKILSQAYVNANKEGVDTSINTVVNIKCGCVSNFDLYASTTAAALTSANTLNDNNTAYLDVKDLYNGKDIKEEYYYPYTKQYECVSNKDAGKIGGFFDSNGKPFSEIMFITDDDVKTSVIELMGVPSSTSAYVSRYNFDINCGVPIFDTEGNLQTKGVKYSFNIPPKQVYLTKWIVTNFKGFRKIA